MSTASILRQTVLALLALAAIGAALLYAANRFASFELAKDAQRQSRPRVVGTRPVDGEQAAPANTSVSVDLFTPVTGRGVDPTTLDGASVRLVRLSTGQGVAANLTAAADGGSVSLTPLTPLAAGESYRIEVSASLRDETGDTFIPYSATFRVAGGTGGAERVSSAQFAYEQVPVTDSIAPSVFTALAIGPAPDGGEHARDLFAATADGRIFRYGISEDGNLWQREVLFAVSENNAGPRLVSGLAFDPRNPGVLWVSHGVAALSGAPDFSGKLSTLSGADYSAYADRLVGLPRAFKDHLNFGIAFGPDGALYLSQGSNTSVGAPDAKWNNRPERLLSAAILRILTDRLPTDAAMDVTTPDGGGSYDPFAADAPVTIHATGVRSGYCLLWHSSGRLYAGINGAGRGGNTPPVREEDELVGRPLMSVNVTTDDTLAELAQGSYHGHPNPARGEHVLMGGNPTSGLDPYEVPGYAVVTQPEPHFKVPVYSFGKGYSPNGLAEARAPVFGGALQGCLFVARFSAGDDILVLRLDSGGNVVETLSGIEGLTNLASPLALVEDSRSGNLYVTEFDKQRIVLLRPR